MAKYLNLAGLQTLWAKAKGAFAPKTHTHNFTEIQEPIAEKTYTGLIASSNTNGNGADFIMIDLAHVSDTSKIFKLRVRIEASYKRSNDNVTYTSTHDCLIYGTGGNGSICSAMWNSHRNTSYRPMYYFVAYRPSTATANWKLGVCLYNCNNNTTAGNERTITMKVISQENCSATLYDSCANTDYTTYYKNMAGRTTYNCADNGLQETGDVNTTTNVYAKEISGYSGTAAGTAAKTIDFAQFVYTTGSRVFKAYIASANTANTPTINVNGQGAKTLYLLTADNTWTVASSTNKTITAGSHWFYWNGTYMYMLPDACNSSAIPTDVAYINGQVAYATKNVFVNGVLLVKGTHFRLRVDAVNTNTGNLSLNVNCRGAKPLFVNGARANGTSNNLVADWYEVVYDGTNYNAYNAAGGGIVYPEASHADSASAAKSGSSLETAINGKQNALAAQTAYSAKGSATKVPKITTNSLGQVTNIEEVTITQPDVSGKADDTAVVHLSGTETVTGVKTFSNSTTNIVNPQATDITRLRVFKPGETNWNGGVRLQLEYDPDGGRGLWDSNISENDGNVLWIDAGGRVQLHGTADLAAGVTTNGKTNSVTSGSTLCLTSGGAFSNLLRKGTVGGFYVLKSTVRKQLANRNTWYNLSQNLPFVMPPKSAVLLTFSVVSMNADQSLSPAYTFTAQFYCGTSSPPADGTKQGYIFTQQMTTGSVRILPILAVNDSDEIKNFCLWAKAKDSYDVNFCLDGGTIWGMGLYGTDFIAI